MVHAEMHRQIEHVSALTITPCRCDRFLPCLVGRDTHVGSDFLKGFFTHCTICH